MGKIKSFFKHKFVITSLIFLLAGAITFGVLKLIPRSRSYTSVIEATVLGKEMHMVLTFKDGQVVTSNKYEDGEEIEVSRQDYEIKDGILYIEGREFGKIDAFKIYKESNIIINSQKVDVGYESKSAMLAKYISFGLIGLGGVMFALAAYVGITKKKSQ